MNVSTGDIAMAVGSGSEYDGATCEIGKFKGFIHGYEHYGPFWHVTFSRPMIATGGIGIDKILRLTNDVAYPDMMLRKISGPPSKGVEEAQDLVKEGQS